MYLTRLQWEHTPEYSSIRILIGREIFGRIAEENKVILGGGGQEENNLLVEDKKIKVVMGKPK